MIPVMTTLEASRARDSTSSNIDEKTSFAAGEEFVNELSNVREDHSATWSPRIFVSTMKKAFKV